jgi:hypothetical protein
MEVRKMAEKNPIKEIEKIEEKAAAEEKAEEKPEAEAKQERYEAVYIPETLGVRDNKTGEILSLKEKRTLEGQVGTALVEARKLNELWEIRKATGI